MNNTGESIDAQNLLNIFSLLTRFEYFSYNTHSNDPDAFVYLEDYFIDELRSDPKFLDQFASVHEITLMMKADEFQSFILQLTGDAKQARNKTRYLLKQMTGDRLCVVNVIKERVDPIKAMAADHKEALETSEVESFMDDGLKKIDLIARMVVAIEEESFELAAELRDKIAALG